MKKLWIIFCLRAMKPELVWKEKLLKFSFWTINGGMMAMMMLSLLPIGLMQTVESVNTGYWSARSPEFMQTEIMQWFRWMRVFGDSIFAVGAVAFVWFAIDLMLKKPKTETEEIPAGELVEI